MGRGNAQNSHAEHRRQPSHCGASKADIAPPRDPGASEPVTLTRIPGPLPKSGHHAARHEHTLIAAARSQRTASSPPGTFSPAELTEDRVVTRFITPSVAADGKPSVPRP